MTNGANRKLFSPVQIRAVALQHRVVMAPLTRSRSVQPGDIPGDLMAEYYGQRASEGGLILRVKDGIFVEHWDVIQDETAQEQSKSGNPIFGDAFPVSALPNGLDHGSVDSGPQI